MSQVIICAQHVQSIIQARRKRSEKMYDNLPPGMYRRGGIVYVQVFGGPDMPLINLGPGPTIDPIVIGPCKPHYEPKKLSRIPRSQALKNLAALLEELKDKADKKASQ